MRCPEPIIELARVLPSLALGTVVEVAATDVAARVDIPAFCRMRGHDYLGEQGADDGASLYLVRRAV